MRSFHTWPIETPCTGRRSMSLRFLQNSQTSEFARSGAPQLEAVRHGLVIVVVVVRLVTLWKGKCGLRKLDSLDGNRAHRHLKIGSAFEFVVLALVDAGVADGFAGQFASYWHQLKLEFFESALNLQGDFGLGQTYAILGIAVKHVGSQFAALGHQQEFDVGEFVSEHNQGPAVGRFVAVTAVVVAVVIMTRVVVTGMIAMIVAGVLVFLVVAAAAPENKGSNEEKGKKQFHKAYFKYLV